MNIFPGKTWREERDLCGKFMSLLRKLGLDVSRYPTHPNDVHRRMGKAADKMKERVLKEYDGRLHK